METKEAKKNRKVQASAKEERKSKFGLAWENPSIKPFIVEILDMRAVLK